MFSYLEFNKNIQAQYIALNLKNAISDFNYLD